MAVNFKYSNTQLTASLSTVYTVPDNTTAIVEAVTVTNTDGSARTVDVHFVPSGDVAGVDNKIIDTESVPMTEQIALDVLPGQNLASGDIISALADAATVVNLRISVREIS